MINYCNSINSLGFRDYYKHRTGLKLKSNIHVHHIDMNRENNNLSNLVHSTSLKHLRYHRLIRMVKDVLNTLKTNGYNLKDLKEYAWLRRFCIPFKPMDNWWDKLYTCEKYLIKNTKKRNYLTGINIINEYISSEERCVIEIYRLNK